MLNKMSRKLGDTIVGVSRKIRIDELVGFEDEEKPTLHITTEAFWKADTYAEIVKILAMSEVYGHLIAPIAPLDGIVRDAYLSHSQKVVSGHCDVNQEGILIEGQTLFQNGNRMIGWWHSHKPVRSGFHSGDDDANFRSVMNSYFNNNPVLIPVKIRPKSNDLYTLLLEGRARPLGFFFDKLAPNNQYDYRPPEPMENLLQLGNGWSQWDLRVRTAYSLVVAERGKKPWAGIAYQNPFFPAIREDVIIFQRMPIILYDTTNFVTKSPDQLKRELQVFIDEVKERVTQNGQPLTGQPPHSELNTIIDYNGNPTYQILPRKSERYLKEFEEGSLQALLPIVSQKQRIPSVADKLLSREFKPRDYKAELEEYQSTHAYTNEQYEALQRRVSELGQRVSQLTASQQAQLQQKDAELARQKELTEQQKAEYKQRLNAKISELLSDIVDKKRQEKARYASRLKGAVGRILRAYERKATAREIELITQTRQQVEAEYAGKIKETEIALQQVQAQASSLEQRLTSAQQQVTSLTQAATVYPQKEQEYERRLTELEQRATAAEQARYRAQAAALESERKVGGYEATIRKKDEEIERLKSEKAKEVSLFSKIKNAAKTVLGYSPVVGALMKKDEVVDRATKTLEGKIQNEKIDGKELYEIMYSSGVNNAATRNAIKRNLEEKRVAIEGKIESKYLAQSKVVDFINNIGIGRFKIGNIGDGLQIYKGENCSKWDAFKRNTKIGGEVSALMQGTAVATFGYSVYQGASSAAYALENRLRDTKYQGLANRPLAWATGLLGFSAAINSGNLTALARASNNVYSQASGSISRGLNKLSSRLKEGQDSGIRAKIGNYLERMVKHNDKLAYLTQLAGQGFMLGTMADAAYAQYQEEMPEQREIVTKPETQAPQETKPSEYFAPSQLEELSKAGWKYVGDSKFEYKLGEEDQRFGKGISQILKHSDTIIGSDPLMSARDSALLAHQVAITLPSEVTNTGDGTFRDLRNPLKYVIHQGDRLYATSDVIRTFFK